MIWGARWEGRVISRWTIWLSRKDDEAGIVRTLSTLGEAGNVVAATLAKNVAQKC